MFGRSSSGSIFAAFAAALIKAPICLIEASSDPSQFSMAIPADFSRAMSLSSPPLFWAIFKSALAASHSRACPETIPQTGARIPAPIAPNDKAESAGPAPHAAACPAAANATAKPAPAAAPAAPKTAAAAFKLFGFKAFPRPLPSHSWAVPQNHTGTPLALLSSIICSFDS